MCGSMVDIQSATAEIRRGIKRRKKKREKRNHRTKYNVRICYAGRPANIINEHTGRHLNDSAVDTKTTLGAGDEIGLNGRTKAERTNEGVTAEVIGVYELATAATLKTSVAPITFVGDVQGSTITRWRPCNYLDAGKPGLDWIKATFKLHGGRQAARVRLGSLDRF